MAFLLKGMFGGMWGLLPMVRRRKAQAAVREFHLDPRPADASNLFEYPVASGSDMKVPQALRVARLVVMGNKGTRAVHKGDVAAAVATAFKGYCTEKGFRFYDDDVWRLNIFGIRNESRNSGTFDDSVVLLFRDDSRQWVCEIYVATTDPGTAWLVKGGPTGKGVAILAPGQYEDTYDVAKHKGKYAALCQMPGRPVAVYRDNNRDNKLDMTGPKDVGVFWINIHHANIPNARSFANRSLTIKDLVRKYSAGCQVIACKNDFSHLMSNVRRSQRQGYNTFTYTLLDEGHVGFRRRVAAALQGGGYTPAAAQGAPPPPPPRPAPAPAPPRPGGAGGGMTYAVKAGDTLWGISQRVGASVDALLAANPGLTSDIHPGQVLRLP